MMPSGHPNPMRGAQSVPASLLRSNSGLMGGAQNNSMQSQPPYSSLVSPRTQFNSNSLLANISNVSSLLNHSYQNGGAILGNGGMPMNLQQRSSVDMLGNAENDPMSFGSSSGASQGQQFHNASGNQLGSDHQQNQQLDSVPNFQQQFQVPAIQQQQQQQRGGMGNMGQVKMEQQTGPTDQSGGPMQQLQALRGMNQVKMEPQQLQSLRSLGPLKMETQQHSDASMFLQQQQQQQQQQHQQQQHQQQQQQQFMQLSRQSSQAAAAVQMNLLQQQQQRLLQQQQQQLILKSLPQQRAQLQQQLHQQNFSVRPPQAKPSVYEPGTGARRLTLYMHQQQQRPDDNNIEFWRKFVAEYFAPNAKKRWCVSQYGSGRQTGVFPQDGWHCEICNRKPGRGFETTVEVLPRLCQIKYASGTLEELLYVDMPREYQNTSGQIVLDYSKAIQESVFEQLRVVRDGQLRVVFNPDLKIASWEFCARRHEELIPRRVIIPQVSQLGAVVHKYQAATQNASSGLSTQDLQNTCTSFVGSARQLAKALEVPLVNDLGYTKRYVRCLQISEVVNSMKDLIDYSRETGTGPMDSLIKFPRRTAASSGLQHQQAQQPPPEDQQPIPQNSNDQGPNPARATSSQLAVVGNGTPSVNNSVNNAPSSSTTSTITIAGLLHQNSMNSRQENQMGTVNNIYSGGGNNFQIPSACSSNSAPPQPNSSPFPSPTLSSSNNHQIPTAHNNTQLNAVNSPANMSKVQQGATESLEARIEADISDSQSSVQQILQDMMMSSQFNGVGNYGHEMKGMNNNGMGFGGMGGMNPSSTASGIRAAMAMNGRVGMNHMSQDPTTLNHQQQQQDAGNRLLGELRPANNFNNLQFDWKM